MKSKGSTWSKWDLHFHTPSSYDYADLSVTNDEIIQTMKANNISVFAVTDHHVIDIERYKELRRIGKDNDICVLPGIEFLSDAKGKSPIHFIGIFSEDCNIDYVWGQLKNNTEIKDIEGKGKKANEVYCDLKDTIDIVKNLDGIVSIHAGSKHGSVENITHSLPQSMAQKTDIANLVDIYELGKADDAAGYREKVFPVLKFQIPMIICSDNHNIKKYTVKEKHVD